MVLRAGTITKFDDWATAGVHLDLGAELEREITDAIAKGDYRRFDMIAKRIETRLAKTVRVQLERIGRARAEERKARGEKPLPRKPTQPEAAPGSDWPARGTPFYADVGGAWEESEDDR